jgi:hypothetical protein
MPFDKTSYQREYMRKRRAKEKDFYTKLRSEIELKTTEMLETHFPEAKGKFTFVLKKVKTE